jgi:hypothetical protein
MWYIDRSNYEVTCTYSKFCSLLICTVLDPKTMTCFANKSKLELNNIILDCVNTNSEAFTLALIETIAKDCNIDIEQMHSLAQKTFFMNPLTNKVRKLRIKDWAFLLLSIFFGVCIGFQALFTLPTGYVDIHPILAFFVFLFGCFLGFIYPYLQASIESPSSTNKKIATSYSEILFDLSNINVKNKGKSH